VVDNQETAVYCTEFLKEKGLFKELLVLSNVPERQINHKMAKDLKNADAYLVYDVVEVSRSHNLLDRAIRYFLNDKVVCDSFDTAIKLQGQGVKDIVTYDGTEFKQGMISGGQHKNIFAVNLGHMQLDKDIKNLSNEVAKLQAELNELVEGENGDSEHARVVKEVTKIETEIDIIK
jgi:chromosome segregation ATPase